MQLTGPRQLLILLLLTAITLLLLIIQPAEEPALRSLAPSPVLVNLVSRTDLYPVELVSGHLQPVRRAWLRFEVDGRVAERRVEAGQSVTVGDVLLALDDQDYQDALIQAQAAWQQAEEDRQHVAVQLGPRVVQQQVIASTIEVSRLVREEADKLRRELPPSIQVGLLFATALILVAVPCFYLIADDLRQRMSGWMRGGVRHPAGRVR